MMLYVYGFHQNVFHRNLHIVGEHMQKGNIFKSPFTLSVLVHSHTLLQALLLLDPIASDSSVLRIEMDIHTVVK